MGDAAAAAADVERVLVVDDNLQNRLVAEGYLSTAGYAVTLAEGGPQALEAFVREQPSLVLLDVLMPGMDGFEVCRAIRALPGGREVPIVFLTALADLGSYHRAVDAGADDYLPKPINRIELQLRARSLLRIRRLQRALQDRNARLVAAQEQRRRLAALLVHDLKGPLASQVLNCEYLLDAGLPSEAAEALEDVLAAGRWMQRMVSELLDIHQAEDAELRVHLSSVDAEGAVRDVFMALAGLADASGHHLAVRVDPPDLHIRADADLLHRVLLNLVDNGLKYAPRNTRLDVSIAAGDGHAEIVVHDDGPGIAPDQREAIFSVYGRLETTARQPGRGLGLAFCRLAVNAHGGTIEVVDSPAGGTTFRITLPQASDAPRS